MSQRRYRRVAGICRLWPRCHELFQCIAIVSGMTAIATVAIHRVSSAEVISLIARSPEDRSWIDCSQSEAHHQGFRGYAGSASRFGRPVTFFF